MCRICTGEGLLGWARPAAGRGTLAVRRGRWSTTRGGSACFGLARLLQDIPGPIGEARSGLVFIAPGEFEPVGPTSQDTAAKSVFEPSEARWLGWRLFSVMLGGGLLAIGWCWGLVLPDQDQVAGLAQLLAVLLLSWHVIGQAARGFLTNDPGSYGDQLVALAILAAFVMGDLTTAGLVPLLMEAGHVLEERSVIGARAAIAGIRKLGARTATLLEGDEERTVEVPQLRVGDRIVVRAGETTPTDATVLGGRSSVDQSPVTGESLPEEVQAGSSVFAGTVNIDGLLRLEVRGVGRDTALGRIEALLRQAEETKAPITRMLERYAAVYLPVVLAVAGIALFVSGDVGRAIAVLVVACPCALVLSGPAAMLAALAVAARSGVLIKNSEFLERASEVDTLILDKTGTVTLGELSVIALYPSKGVSEDDLLRSAATCGLGSLHPVSRAIVAAARERGLAFSAPSEAHEQAGAGLEAHDDGRSLLLGRASWLKERGLEPFPELRGSGIATWVAEEGRVLGAIQLADRPRPEARGVLDALRARGLRRIVLVTGAREEVAAAVARELGIEAVHAEVLPERKAEFVRKEQAEGRHVMMVGDGINDALALHSAHVGVAIGANINEVALGSADIALIGGDLVRLPRMLELAGRTRATVNLNVAVGVSFSVLMLGLAALGIIPPALGALLHNGGALFVVVNSARLLALTQVED